MPVIQCPECQKKLKLKALKEGAKVKCPGCAKIFRPTAADAEATSAATKTSKPSKARSATSAKSPAAKPTKRRPAKKKRPAPVDDFDDFDDFGGDDFGDDDYGDGDDFGAAPARRPRSGGKKAAKKKPVETKSKKPLIIGLAVIAIAALGGGAFWLFGGGSDEGGGDTNIADTNNNNAGENAGEDEDASHAASNDTNQAEPDQSPAMAASSPQAGSNDGGQSANGTTAATNVGTFSSESSPVDLKWMPASTEGLLHIKIPELMKGPLGALVNLPQLAPQIEQFKAIAGMDPDNIQSITVGVSRISEMSQQQKEPNPESMSLVAIVRADRTIDASKIMLIEPRASQVTEGSLTYYKIPINPPVAIWMADDQTAVIGAESVVQQVATQDGSTSNLDTGLLNGQSSIEIAFSPAIPDAIFRHPNFRIPDGGPAPVPPPIRTLVAAMKEHTVGASIGITLTEDLGFKTAFRSRDAAGATKFQQTFQSVMEELKNMPNPSADGQGIPPMMAGFMVPLEKIGEDMNESFQMSTSGTLTSSTMEARGGGQTLSGFVPLASMMLLPAIQAGQSAAQTTQGRNNMKQIGLAMFNFHDAYGRFPNAVGKGPNGEQWLSWRVHLLPFLGYEELYNQFALEEPWDSATNRPLVNQMPDVYRSPAANVPGGKTLYQVPVAPGSAFEDSRGHAIRDFTDGTSNTILLVEVDTLRAAEWTRPVDYSFSPSDPLEGLLVDPAAGYKVAYADGSVRTIAPSTSTQDANAMFTRNAGDIAGQ